MKYIDKISALANHFEKKISLAQEITQMGTTELFFDSDINQRAFAAAAQSPNGPIFKILSNFWSKTEKPCGFTLKVNANPGAGASWDLTVNPPSLMGPVKTALDSVFKSIMKENMAFRLSKANDGAKKGSGSGALPIAELELAE